MKHLFLSIFMVLSVVFHTQGQTKAEVKSAGVLAQPSISQPKSSKIHIQDAETGEALPYVSVTTSAGKGTLTNADGDFNIVVSDKDTLRISCVGYVTQNVIVAELPKTIMLTPAVRQMREVTVMSMDAILDRAQRQLKHSLASGSNLHNTYFCRIAEEMGERVDMVEAIVEARSMVQLRDMEVLTGRLFRPDMADDNSPLLSNMNMHHFLELAPMMKYNAFWDNLLVLPFNGKNLGKMYSYDYSTLDDGMGGCIYSVELKAAVRTGAGRLMTGTAYVEAASQRLLRFQGSVPSVLMMNKIGNTGQTSDVMTTFTIDYTYDRNGMAEVSNICFDTRGNDIHVSGLMQRTSNKGVPLPKGKNMKENMIASIKDAGFDSLMLANHNFIQRTSREERLSNHSMMLDGPEATYLHLDNSMYMLGDTIWFSAYTRDVSRARPSEISRVLHVELLGLDGSLVERRLVEMTSGHGQGYFSLKSSSLPLGQYRLRAYTLWQRNWSDSNPELLYSKTILVVDTPQVLSPTDVSAIPLVAEHGNVHVEGLKDKYEPFQKVEIKVKVPASIGSSHLSIAIRDWEGQDASVTDDNVLLLAQYATESKGSRKSHPREQTITLCGRAIRNEEDTAIFSRWDSDNQKGYVREIRKEAYIHAMLRSNKGDIPLPHIQTENDGSFKLHLPVFYGQCMLYIGATELDARQLVSHRWNVADDPYAKESVDRRKNRHKPSPFRIEMDYPYLPAGQVYGDQCIPIHGFAYPADFYHPDYSKHPLPEGQHDYRRTLYWNPNLQLDENGEATITFYNNSRTTRLSIEAEGQASDGTLLWGR